MRNPFLQNKDIKVLRIKNEELSDINNVIGIIEKTIKVRINQLSDNMQNTSPSLNLKGRGRGKG